MGGVIQHVVGIGDGLLGAERGRRSVISRLAEELRAEGGLALPHDLSGGGLRGAIRTVPTLVALRPSLIVVALGWSDAGTAPAPSWWIPDADALLRACLSLAPTVLVWSPVPEQSGNRPRRWHSRIGPKVIALAESAEIPLVDASTVAVSRFLSAQQSEELARAIAASV